MVVLTDHSTPDTGDLHTAPQNLAAAPLDEVSVMAYAFTQAAKLRSQVLDAFLDNGLRSILAKGEHSTLVLHSCGGVVAHKGPLDYLKGATADTKAPLKKREFSQILAFTQQNLQLAFTNRFLSDYALNLFIHEKEHIGCIIFDNQTLGAHTDVMLFKDGEQTHFFWGHPILRPHGKAAPPMCKNCRRLLPWKIDSGEAGKSKKGKDEKVTLHHICIGCGAKEDHDLPEGAEWVRNHTYGDSERGAWFVVKKVKAPPS
jgi:hypothetical protein